MTDEEWDAIPKERFGRLLAKIKNKGRRCIDCFEQLTESERAQGRSYCTDCYPKEMEADALD